jgi:hypothetical protein
MFFQEQVILLESFERTRTTDLNDGLHHDPTLPRLSWRPKISPYRFMVFSIPLAIANWDSQSCIKLQGIRHNSHYSRMDMWRRDLSYVSCVQQSKGSMLIFM